MKTSITETIRTERFLTGELSSQERLLYDAQLLIDPSLRTNTFFHAMVHRLLKLYHRKEIKREIEALSERMLRDPKKKHLWESVFKHFKS